MTQYYKIIDNKFDTIGAISVDAVEKFCRGNNYGFHDILNAWIIDTQQAFAEETGTAAVMFKSLQRHNKFAALAQTAVGINTDVFESDIPDPLSFEVVEYEGQSHYVIGAETQDYGLTVLTIQTVDAWHNTWDDVPEGMTVEKMNLELVVDACVALSCASTSTQQDVSGPVRSSELRQADITDSRTKSQPVAQPATSVQSSDGVQIAPGFFGVAAPQADDVLAAARNKLKNFVNK